MVVPRGARVRPTTNWARAVLADPVAVAVGSKIILATFGLSNPGIGEVVRRTRGWFWVASDQVSAMEYVAVAFGMAVVTDAALAAGAASIPGPSTDLNDDVWFVWETVMALSQSADGLSGVSTGAQVGGCPGVRLEGNAACRGGSISCLDGREYFECAHR